MQNLLKLIEKFSVLLVLMLFFANSYGQQLRLVSDLQLCDSLKHNAHNGKHTRAYIFKGKPASFKTLNPVSMAFGGALFVYQNYVSQHFSASCLYHPSCSDFSKQVVTHYGLIKGGLLTVDRLGRCNRIAATDLDKVLFDPVTHRFPDPIERYK
ncbi:MAG: membrane protein insertion efficiency factor YidD [Prolixibacteraceae bacterium]|jgi:putative component of membrane protein insertase Oxa1/YidC/SpoIIIJ protein YidD|nr:membrane protein insertion efficiency factor YidD [Prolixibacteraceae bacterium]